MVSRVPAPEPPTASVAATDALGVSNAFEEFRARCEASRISVYEETVAPNETWRSVSLPRGPRGSQTVGVNSTETVVALLSFPFEQLRFIGSYDAVVYYDTGTIEAAVRQNGAGPSLRADALVRSFPDLAGGDDGEFVLRLVDRGRAPNVELELSAPTARFTAVVHSPLRQRLSLKIRGLGVSRHDVALRALETLSDALFLDLDRNQGLALDLFRTRRAPRFRGPRARGAKPPMKLPSNRYDHEAASLYRYARAARGMPLLQFLGYYQVIEFYIPRYTQIDARRRVERLVKDPSFNPHDGRDITRLMNVTNADGRMPGPRDERGQLKTTLRECIEIGDIVDFLDEQGRGEFFARKNPTLTRYQVTVRNQAVDLRDQVADRIYDLRCKIVHTKDSGASDQIELLLPNSAEAEMLQDDIELLRFIAMKTLIASSDPLTYRFG